MLSEREFQISKDDFFVRSRAYKLNKISNVQVKINGLPQHILRGLVFGLLFASIVFIFSQHHFASQPAQIAFAIGAFYGLYGAKKYELQLEMDKGDETGLQWHSIVSSSKVKDLQIFEEVANDVREALR